ncbi:MAG: DUF1207 domain-containing protein [Gemmatimonadetes bacterium]|nr:DUF1207 domain-containing protein [Gemmatimonadota bacterium]
MARAARANSVSGWRDAGRQTIALAAALLALAAFARPARAQGCADGDAIFPDCRPFRERLADPSTPRIAVGAIVTNLFEGPLSGRSIPPIPDAQRDVQGIAALGTTLSLVRLASWPEGGGVLGLEGGVIERFRLELPTNDAVAADWRVALRLDARRGPYSLRASVAHRSAHLGDELIESTGIRRLRVTGEAFELLLARAVGPARVYAGGSRTLRSTYPGGTGAVRAGADFSWPVAGPLTMVAGAEWERAALAGEDNRLSAVAGVVLHGRAGRATLAARYFDGPSALGEFFADQERYWGFELVLDPRS